MQNFGDCPPRKLHVSAADLLVGFVNRLNDGYHNKTDDNMAIMTIMIGSI